ncbi:hypothetical protein [Hyalangium versicolor]|uniref:hypothetical protein n=1 Tax=Hyalangium versicolor TaxID=2861190 RepID=UPI001CC95505|nr:hypothetical protein [Hyalangium versicolor]
MAETTTDKTEKQAAGKRGARGSKRSTGRIQVRRDTAGYTAAAQEQAARVREEIDSALADGQRIRAEIEARIETQWHNKPAPQAAAPARGGRRRREKA